jgi:WD40 repeat protein
MEPMFNHIQPSLSNPDEFILTNNNSEQNNSSNSNNNIQFNTSIISPDNLEQGQKKQIKFVNQILILESGNFIVGSSSDIFFYNKNFTIKFKKENVTNSGIKDMCLIDQNTFGVCSHRDIIIIKIIENNFKIIRIFIDPHDDHWVNSIIFSKNKILISSSIYDEKIKVWDILNQSDQPIQQLNHKADGLFEWNENIFISSGYKKTKIWNKINNKLNYQLMNTFINIPPDYLLLFAIPLTSETVNGVTF